MGGWLWWTLLACRSSPPTSAPTPVTATEQEEEGEWTVLWPGLEWGEWRLPQSSTLGDSRVHMARIDPARFSVELRMTSRDGEARTLAAWAETVPADRPVVAINAAMFAEDWSQSIGRMIDGDHTNHAAWVPDQRSLLVAKPLRPGLPSAAILQRGCDPEGEGEGEGEREVPYGLQVQSLRLLGCVGETVWAQQPEKRWSAALLGQDDAGRLLLMHVRSPYTMHDLAEGLRALPLGLVSLHYGDGGPPAALYVRTPGAGEKVRVGSYESQIQEDDDHTGLWSLPNVILAVGAPQTP